jgi:hypothetical protein
MKMAVFWVVVPYSPAEVCRRFRGACCLIIGAIFLTMEAARASETSVNFYHNAWHNNPENSRPHLI